MISAVGTPESASSPINALLRELGSAPRGRNRRNIESVDRGSTIERVSGKSELTDDERREIEKLRQRDAEIRRHEAAHKAAAGSSAKGGPKFEFTRGPDGQQYATGGEVQIDTSKVPGDPKATIRKMQQIRRAASAPAEPSSQDRSVAAQAAQIEAQARSEISEQRSSDVSGSTSPYPISTNLVSQPMLRAASTSPERNPQSIGSFIDVHA